MIENQAEPKGNAWYNMLIALISIDFILIKKLLLLVMHFGGNFLQSLYFLFFTIHIVQYFLITHCQISYLCIHASHFRFLE